MANDRRSGSDRRQDERHSVKINLEWEGEIGKKSGTICDISVTGCYILCSGEVEDGEKVNIYFPLSTGMKVLFRGEVINHLPDIGFAARFIELSEAQKDFLEKFADTLKN